MLIVPDPQWVLSLTETEQLAWIIALGEARGGRWNYKKSRWGKPPQPKPVFAIPAQMRD